MSSSSLLSLLWWVAVGLLFFWMMGRGGCGGMAHGHGGHSRTHADDEGARFRSSSGKPIDPACRMEVDPARAAGTRLVEGQTFFFCSTTCLQAFDKNPGAYTPDTIVGEPGHHHGC